MKYKLLGRSGLKVSELCLGTMGFGTEGGWGADKETSFKIMERFAEAGGNFLDTANIYKLGSSEKIIGEFINARDRDFFVLATKYTLLDNKTNPNASGNNRKNMMRSVEQSLKRLQTDFIDVLYLHIWDDLTPIDEVLRGLDDLIRQGKVNYAAISDTPAWIVAKGNTMAALMGWSQFIALQIEYSLLQRTPERELIPMAKHFGMTVTPWAPLAGGALTGKYLRGDKGRIKENSSRLNENSSYITKEVVAIAEKSGVEAAHVALRWTMQQPLSVIPVVGATKLEQLEQNLKTVDVILSEEDMKHLDEISAIDAGFPMKFFKEEAVQMNTYGGFYDKIEKAVSFIKLNTMTYDEFILTIENDEQPPNKPLHIQALWLDAKNNWHKAHSLIDSLDDKNACWVHAYLHRKEGDISNADYWYRRAGKQRPKESLQEEWKNITMQLLLQS